MNVCRRQGRIQDFGLRGRGTGRFGGRKSPSGVQWRSPGGVCDRLTDGQAPCDGIGSAMHTRRAVKITRGWGARAPLPLSWTRPWSSCCCCSELYDSIVSRRRPGDCDCHQGNNVSTPHRLEFPLICLNSRIFKIYVVHWLRHRITKF